MRLTTRRTLAALALAATTALAGCGGSDHDDDDVAFAQQMIPHHAQAVAMADLTIGRDGLDPRVADLAERIRGAQTPEINTMTTWLKAWGEDVPRTGYASGDGHTHSDEGMGMGDMPGGDMPGMTSGAQMRRLDRAEGAAFQRLWLQMMVRHHSGAVAMAREELSDGASEEAKALARRIVAGQQAEIRQMRALLRR